MLLVHLQFVIFFAGGHIFTCFFLSLSLTLILCCFICSHLLSFSRLFSMHVLFILEGKENNNKKNREDRLLFQLFEGQAHFLIKPKWKLSHCPETQEIKETQIVCFRFFEVFLPFFFCENQLEAVAEVPIANIVKVQGVWRVAASELHTKFEIRWYSRWPGSVFCRVMQCVAIWWCWVFDDPLVRPAAVHQTGLYPSAPLDTPLPLNPSHLQQQDHSCIVKNYQAYLPT